MGTLITNEKFDIDFEVGEILQKDLEVYERALSQYLEDSEYSDNMSEAVFISAVVIGAMDAKFIPMDVFETIEDVLNSSPAKVAFIAARIAEIVNNAKIEKVDFEYECPEITQGALESYEKARKKIVSDMKLSNYEMGKSNATLVKIGIEIGWIPSDLLIAEDIPTSKPNKVKYLSDKIMESLTEARTISGE